MSLTKRFLLAVAIAVAALAPTAAPAQPGYGYFIVSDYTLNADILGGPFSYDGCQFALLKGNFKAPAHCEVRSW